ncbi:hydroxypyruvate isomerase [Marinobacter bryozoorum]|jgi:hydroxypyruvate isomerase|uniref:hydroxypyruvate isomerase n=1 Tax=Marinobacter bryozoorum TaxID=256324 RepID=UPI002002AA3D|nr:hydroxypyruvate isomerase [Marinobacter bryozoorum]MCK7542554.1 hydroxypyruvate isomerase [Marinobacter bryozoorum]
MPRFAANLTLLFNEVPFEDRFAAARAAGFTGVEYLFPYAWPETLLAGKLRENGLTQVLFNLPPGDWDAGERGIAGLPGREEEFRQGVDQAIRYARALDCKQLNCLAGLAPAGADPEQLWSTLRENVGWAAERLAQEGITLCLEAINSRVDMPGFLLDTSDKVLRLMDEAGADNVRLQYDLYHMQIMEGDLIRSLQRLMPRIGHIQFADNPGRHEPGTGEINFRSIFQALDDAGYTGWVSAEYRPKGRTEGGLGWLQAASGTIV